MQDADARAAAHAGEATGLTAGKRVVNIQVVETPASRSACRPLQRAIPLKRGGLLAIEGESRLGLIFRLGLDPDGLGADIRTGWNDELGENDVSQAPHFEVRYRPLRFQLGKGSAGVVVVRVGEILDIEHRHDDLGRRTDFHIGHRAGGGTRVHGHLQAGFDPRGRQDGGEGVRIGMLDHTEAIGDGNRQLGGPGEWHDECLAVQAQRGGDGG